MRHATAPPLWAFAPPLWACASLLWVIIPLAAASLTATKCGADEPLRLRVLTYNIHHGEGVDGQLDLKRIAEVITAAQPDLVALQEVDQNTQRTGQVDQAAELARLTGMHACFGGNLELQGGQYGNTILSRLPIAAHANHRLPNLDPGEPRGVLIAEIEVPELARPLRFLSTHLDHRPPERNRLASVAEIEELCDSQPPGPMVLAGDLNAVPTSETIERFLVTWQSASDQPLATVPANRPQRQLDYVLCRPAASWKVVDARVIDEAVASDHRPLLAVLELRVQ